MSFSKLVKKYIDQNSDVAPLTPSAPSWLRKVAGPAAIGLSMGFGLVGCGGADPIDQGSVMDLTGKADSLEKNCWSNKDCGPKMECQGMRSCPEGAFCILPPNPGKCVPMAKDCYTNKDCLAGEHCLGAIGHCPDGAYCILPPNPGKCQSNAECASDNDCASGQTCKIFDQGDTATGKCPEGAYCILPPSPTPPLPQGVCENTCSTTTDCAGGEQCVKDNVGHCPDGAYCILPPTPQKGVCELHIWAILPPQ
jgi:hypothetical protein